MSKAKWVSGKYNIYKLVLEHTSLRNLNGVVSWESSGDRAGFRVEFAGVRLFQLFKNLDEAKRATESLAVNIAKRLLEEVETVV